MLRQLTQVSLSALCAVAFIQAAEATPKMRDVSISILESGGLQPHASPFSSGQRWVS